MKKQKILVTLSTGLISLCMAGSADALLISRLGGQAYYDTDADLTWLADANYAKTSGYAVASGELTWETANTWVAGLVIDGVGGWRLPTIIDPGTMYSELDSLWIDALGNIPYYDAAGNPDQPGWDLINAGPFSNFKVSDYWSDGDLPYDVLAFMYDPLHVVMNLTYKTDSNYAWAVQSGDVGAVPEPATAWLIGSGLIGLIGAARRKARI